MARFLTVLDKLLLLFKMGIMEREVARGFFKMFAKNASDEQVVKALTMFEHEILPYVLRGEAPK